MSSALSINFPAGGVLGPLFDVNVNETLRRALFCALQHIKKKKKKVPRKRFVKFQNVCFRPFLVRLSGVPPEVVHYMASPPHPPHTYVPRLLNACNHNVFKHPTPPTPHMFHVC